MEISDLRVFPPRISHVKKVLFVVLGPPRELCLHTRTEHTVGVIVPFLDHLMGAALSLRWKRLKIDAM